MICSTCDGSGVVLAPTAGMLPTASSVATCPECSASAMRAQRDEARRVLEGLRENWLVLRAERNAALSQRDAARTALAALLDAADAQLECHAMGCTSRALWAEYANGEARWCEPHRGAIGNHRSPLADAIEAAERVLGRRGT